MKITFNRQLDLKSLQVFWGLYKDSLGYTRGWRVLKFGVCKFKKLPPEGFQISKQYYKGFILNIAFWLPFEIN